MRQHKLDKVITKLYTNYLMKLENDLYNDYIKYRIPQTEYFIEDYHIKERMQRISKHV